MDDQTPTPDPPPTLSLKRYRARAPRIVVQRRLDDLTKLRLTGNGIIEIRQFIRHEEGRSGSAWHIDPDVKPMSDDMIWKYIRRADKGICGVHVEGRRRSRRAGLAKRKEIYRRAMLKDDLKTALEVLKDEAVMRDLYPAKRTAKNEEVPTCKVYLNWNPADLLQPPPPATLIHPAAPTSQEAAPPS